MLSLTITPLSIPLETTIAGTVSSGIASRIGATGYPFTLITSWENNGTIDIHLVIYLNAYCKRCSTDLGAIPSTRGTIVLVFLSENIATLGHFIKI